MMARAALLATALALVVIGTYLFGQGVWIYAKAQLAQVLIGRAWEKRVAQYAEGRGGESAPLPKPWPWADHTPVARLQAPRLGVDLYVLSDDSGRTLAFGPGVSANDREGGWVISGHRDTHFAFLKELVAGDRLIVTLPSRRTFIYQIADQIVFDSEKSHLTLEGEGPGLTLVTCWPFDAIVPGGPMRLAVVADQVI